MKHLLSALYALSFVIVSIALTMVVYAVILPVAPSVASASFFDLIINNLVNFFIAIYLSGYIVRKFESKQHSVAFLIDLAKQANDLCSDMLNIDLEHINSNKQRYIGQANMLIEYSEALQDQVNNMKGCNQQFILVEEMISTAKEHYLSAKMSLNKSDISSSEYDDLQSSIISVQTYIPQIMATIKH